MNWTPLQGCDDPATAMRRAQTMVAIGGMGSGSNNQEWGVKAVQYVQAMLYAAAIADRTINDCYQWSLSPENAQEAAALIREYTDEREMDQWAAVLNCRTSTRVRRARNGSACRTRSASSPIRTCAPA